MVSLKTRKILLFVPHLIMIFAVSGCVMPDLSRSRGQSGGSYYQDLANEGIDITKTSASKITMFSDEIYRSENNLGEIKVTYVNKALVSKGDKAYFVYWYPNKQRIYIEAELRQDESGVVTVPIPDYPARDLSYKDYRLEYADIYLAGTHNLIYFDNKSYNFSSGDVCDADKENEKYQWLAEKGIEKTAYIYFSMKEKKQEGSYRCDFRTSFKQPVYGQNISEDIGG